MQKERRNLKKEKNLEHNVSHSITKDINILKMFFQDKAKVASSPDPTGLPWSSS